MRTIRVVIDDPLLRAADRAVRRLKLNRSTLVCNALRRHLEQIAAAEREARDREGYRKRPQSSDELAAFQKAAAWPED